MASAWLEVRLIGSQDQIDAVLTDMQAHRWEIKADSGTQAVQRDKDGKSRRHFVVRPESSSTTNDNPRTMEETQ